MSLFENNEGQERLNVVIRTGTISTVDYASGTARVIFEDDEKMVSAPLAIIQRNTLKNKDYAMPDIGETVLCLFLPTGVEDGFILGSLYTEENLPSENSPDKRSVLFGDQAQFSYDRATHQLDMKIGETTITVNAQGVTVNSPAAPVDVTAQSANITAPTITLAGNVNVTGTMSIAGKATAKGGMDVTGNVSASGTVTATGEVTGNGVELSGHKHTDGDGKSTSTPN